MDEAVPLSHIVEGGDCNDWLTLRIDRRTKRCSSSRMGNRTHRNPPSETERPDTTRVGYSKREGPVDRHVDRASSIVGGFRQLTRLGIEETEQRFFVMLAERGADSHMAADGPSNAGRKALRSVM